MRRYTLVVAVVSLVVLSACSTSSTPAAQSPAASASTNPCVTNPPVKTAGTLTVGTSYPYYQPFKAGPKDNPTGFEPDVAHAIASRLGLANVAWSVATFESLYAPGPKKWDLAMDEISYTAQRAQVVDFSDPYYVIQQGLLVKKGTPIESAHSIADLAPYHFGAQTGTITAGQALSNGQIDAVVIDVPIAIPMTQQFTNLEVIGQFLTNEGYAMTFEKGGALVACVNQVLAAMKTDGTLKSITDKSFPGTTADIPVFK